MPLVYSCYIEFGALQGAFRCAQQSLLLALLAISHLLEKEICHSKFWPSASVTLFAYISEGGGVTPCCLDGKTLQTVPEGELNPQGFRTMVLHSVLIKYG